MKNNYKHISNELKLVNCHLNTILLGYKSENVLDSLSTIDYFQYLILRKKEEELRQQKEIISCLKFSNF